MNIIDTNIPDVDEMNIDKSKVKLANSIIQSVYPLFDEIYSEKISELKELNKELKTKKEKISQTKNNIESLFETYKKKGKIRKLLSRVSKLSNSGLLYDGSLKNETLILLKVVESLNEDKLNFHLNETMKIINKRFS